ncbi:hypothetical protein [Paracoccus aerodenitrificans]|uniref:hypothetical protein n=1 Tax=Paracoccus aerodenitrificans TaxID=3017781 RepID=UPI0022F06AB3|nr:hypothetical protein [Paracoccus aerodenitrificans]WBU63712.1 hypothetical protein PAE61_15455 [Paracoccus aerodenitrificans]
MNKAVDNALGGGRIVFRRALTWPIGPKNGRSMLALTNTAPEGMVGRFAIEMAEAAA